MEKLRSFETSGTATQKTRRRIRAPHCFYTYLHLSLCLSLSLSQSHSEQIVTFSALLFNTPIFHYVCPLEEKAIFIPGSKIDPWLVHCSLAHRYLWHLLICQRVLTSWWRGKWLPLTHWYKLLAEATPVVMMVRWPCRICCVIDGSKQSLGNTWLGPASRPAGRPVVDGVTVSLCFHTVDGVTVSLCFPHCWWCYSFVMFPTLLMVLQIRYVSHTVDGVTVS
jgi:hypothetical protein